MCSPIFVGVFDTVAALGSRPALIVSVAGLAVSSALTAWLAHERSWLALPLGLATSVSAFWPIRGLLTKVKTYADDPAWRFRWHRPADWKRAVQHGHVAWWSGKNYDEYVDREIPTLRHALSIDEDRANFPRVKWGRPKDVRWNEDRGRQDWLKQVWFAGNHSDVGGSYPEDESRLSYIALDWMVEEFAQACPEVEIQRELLNTTLDPLGLQHSEREALFERQPSWLRRMTGDCLNWRGAAREINPGARLHASVHERLAAKAVPQMSEVKPYRPAALASHNSVAAMIDASVSQTGQSDAAA